MKKCWNCGTRNCGWRGLEEDGPGTCAMWRPHWPRRIAGIIVLVLALIFALLLFLGYAGEAWKEGELEQGRPVRTYSIIELARPAGDSGAYIQDTDIGICEVGAQQQAVWYDARGAHPVPTAWVRVTSSPFTRLRIVLVRRALLREARGGRL